MKTCLVFVVLLAVATASPALSRSEFERRAAYAEANMNEYFDKLVEKIKVNMIENGMDPMQLPDIIKGFSIKILLVTWHGELELTQGWLQDLTTMSRSGDVQVEYDHQMLKAKAEIKFDDLLLSYRYLAKIMNIGPVGEIFGRVEDFRLYIDVLADLETGDVYLQDLKITKTAYIDIEVKGNGLIDILSNAIYDLVTLIFKGQILDLVEGILRTEVEKVLSEIHLDLGGGGQYVH